MEDDSLVKHIIEFNLPEEASELKLALDGSKWFGVIWEMDSWLRQQIKHHGDEGLQPVRDKLYEFMDRVGVSFDDVP